MILHWSGEQNSEEILRVLFDLKIENFRYNSVIALLKLKFMKAEKGRYFVYSWEIFLKIKLAP